jgi:hypothetical protein
MWNSDVSEVVQGKRIRGSNKTTVALRHVFGFNPLRWRLLACCQVVLSIMGNIEYVLCSITYVLVLTRTCSAEYDW